MIKDGWGDLIFVLALAALALALYWRRPEEPATAALLVGAAGLGRAVLLVAHDRLGAGMRRTAPRDRTDGERAVMTVLIETSADRWTRMVQATGVVGLATVAGLATRRR
jgi:hypothetical protein